jgi:hypothetical protein
MDRARVQLGRRQWQAEPAAAQFPLSLGAATHGGGQGRLDAGAVEGKPATGQFRAAAVVQPRGSRPVGSICRSSATRKTGALSPSSTVSKVEARMVRTSSRRLMVIARRTCGANSSTAPI